MAKESQAIAAPLIDHDQQDVALTAGTRTAHGLGSVV
jgi:hypothetical protein